MARTEQNYHQLKAHCQCITQAPRNPPVGKAPWTFPFSQTLSLLSRGMMIPCHYAGMWGCGHLQEEIGWSRVTRMAEKFHIFKNDPLLPRPGQGRQRGECFILMWEAVSQQQISSGMATLWNQLFALVKPYQKSAGYSYWQYKLAGP